MLSALCAEQSSAKQRARAAARATHPQSQQVVVDLYIVEAEGRRPSGQARLMTHDGQKAEEGLEPSFVDYDFTVLPNKLFCRVVTHYVRDRGPPIYCFISAAGIHPKGARSENRSTQL